VFFIRLAPEITSGCPGSLCACGSLPLASVGAADAAATTSSVALGEALALPLLGVVLPLPPLGVVLGATVEY